MFVIPGGDFLTLRPEIYYICIYCTVVYVLQARFEFTRDHIAVYGQRMQFKGVTRGHS